MNDTNKLILIDKDPVNRFWKIKAVLGMLVFPISGILSYFIRDYLVVANSWWTYNIIAFLSGILYYIIVLSFLRYSYKSGYFHPETIPNYIFQVSLIVVGFSLLSEVFPSWDYGFYFISISGLNYMGIAYLAVAYYEKNQHREFSLIREDNQIIMNQKVIYPFLGMKHLLSISVNRELSDQVLPLGILRLEHNQTQFPLRIIRDFKFITEDEFRTDAGLSRIYVLYSMTETDRKGNPRGIVLQNNLDHKAVQSILSKIKTFLPYEIIQIAKGMQLEVDFLSITFKPIL